MDVYEPQEDSEVLARAVKQYAHGACLDMGTGSGIQAFTALQNPHVTSVLAIDSNPAAVDRVAKRIADLPRQQQERIAVILSDQFASVAKIQRFDTIISNPPYLPDEASDKDIALYGGPGGYEWIARFLRGAIAHLAPGGQILLLFSSLSNKERIDAEIKRLRLVPEEVAQLAMFFERLYVYRIRKVS